ncbi:MAG: M28 family metallopeptidase, partial [Acidobacteriota bacterium]
DTVPSIAGANDNASGTAVLVALAEKLSEISLPYTVRFVAFGSEELGLRGSRHNVEALADTELAQIFAMLNFDALGSGRRTGILGDPRLTALAVDEGENLGIEPIISSGPANASSDHASFANAGVPVLMFFAEDFSRIHTPEDTLEFVDPPRLGEAARLALAVLQSPDFPP